MLGESDNRESAHGQHTENNKGKVNTQSPKIGKFHRGQIWYRKKPGSTSAKV